MLENSIHKALDVSSEVTQINTVDGGVEQLEARRVHNPEVAGSSPAPAITVDDVQFLKPGEVARMLCVTKQTLADWRHRGVGPRYYKAPGVRYKLRDILQWQERRAVVPAPADRSKQSSLASA